MKKNVKPLLMAFILFFFMFFLLPGINSSTNLFVLPVSESIGMSRSEYSLTFTISSLVMVVFAFFYGRLYEAMGAKNIIYLTAVFVVVSCVVSAQAQSVGMVYLGALLRGFAMALGSTGIAATLIVHWFEKYRGLVIGIVFSAVGFGGSVLLPFFTKWIADPAIGWRTAYYYIAVIVGISTVIAGFLLKNSPRDAGTVPYGHEDSPSSGASLAGEAEKRPLKKKVNLGLSFEEARKTRTYYAAGLIVLLINFSIYSTYAHMVAFLTQVKIDMAGIGISMAVVALGAAAGKLLYGWICDQFGIRASILLAAVSQVLALLILLLASPSIKVYGGSLIMGFGIGAMQLSVTLLAGIFGVRDYSKIVGVFSGVMGFAWGVGAWVTGLFFDHFGNYELIFSIFIALGVCIGMLTLMLPKRNSQVKPASS